MLILTILSLKYKGLSMFVIQKILIFLLFTTLSLSATVIIDNNNSKQDSNRTKTNLELKKAFTKKSSKILKNISHKRFLKKFYKKNNYQPLWIEKNELNSTKYTALFSQINRDITLDTKSLILSTSKQLEKSLDTNMTQETLFKTEVKLTSLYYNFLRHTLYGGIEWKKFSYRLSALKKSKINASWIRNKAPYNIVNLLKRNDINNTINEVTPKKFGYQGLLLALNKLNKLKKEGAWEKLPSFKKLKLKSSGDMVLQLRERLIKSGDYVVCENNITNDTNQISDLNSTKKLDIEKDAIFDICLDTAVKKFQKRHGLVVDGVVGKGTQRALNITVDEKIRKVLLNLDRIKWLPRDENKRYIVVNIPEFMLHYIEDNESKQDLRVIVGDKRHPTPIFSEKISFVVLNPYWKVPEGIVKREIVPAMIKDPNYLKKQGLEAHRTWSENSRIIDTSWLYWEDYLYGGQKFPYRLMQPPGPRNALGKIKFKFPNRFAVYLHDTPTRHLFKRNVRAFSHGCVRLSTPRKLLETIATFNTNINIKKAKKILKGKRKTQYNMKEKLRIYLVYLTAGMNTNGELQFRNDIYRYDKYQKRSVR